MSADLTLSYSEIIEITGYRQQAKQLAKLQALGFYRARISRLGRVLLERTHYDAVCAGAASLPSHQPQLRQPTLRRGAA